MTDVRDLIRRARQRRFNRPANLETRAVTESGIKPMVYNPNQTRDVPNLTPTESDLRAQFERPNNPPPIDDALAGYQPEDAPTLSPTEQTVRNSIYSPTSQTNGENNSESPLPTAPKISTSEQRVRDLLAMRDAEANRTIEDDDSKFHNFFAGAQNASRQLQRTGNSQADLGYQIGATGIGGLRGLITKKEDDVRDRDKNLSKIDKEIERANKIKEQDLKDRIGEADYKTKSIKGQQDALDYIRSINKPFYDSITGDDRITAEEAAEARKRGFGDIQPYDKRKVETEVRNGETFTRRAGEEWTKDASLPTEKTKAPIKSTLDDGTEVYTTGDKLLDNQIAEKFRQAQINTDADKYNTTQTNAYSESLTKWRNDTTTAGANVSKIDNELVGLIQRRNDPNAGGGNDNFDPTTIDAEIAKKKGELSAAKQIYETAMKNAPKAPAKLSTQNIKAKNLSRSDLDAFARQTKRTAQQAAEYAKQNDWNIID